MSQPGKASIKRGKPSYFMSILGVTLVLFFLGIIGWLVINANKLGNHFKESVEVRVFLRGDLNPKDSVALVNYIAAKPYVKIMEYVTKEAGKKKYIDDGGEDWNKVLTENPLPNAIYFRVKSQFVNSDTLLSIKKDIEQQTYVSDVAYPDALVGDLNKNIRKVSIGLLVLVVIISLVVIFLIDNTIRLAMFSNRFLIKTMQMVGATRWFIAKPLNIKAIINGAISGLIASVILYILILVAEGQIEWLKTIHDSSLLIILFIILILLGIGITLFSTNRSVIKYLRMKLDDLY
ncbi:MAG: permease-like cell division protein FtsX [Bacteroidota bacterium]|nr:permease-like cell division protein FtsX [Bacteroidota bacterium]